MRWMTMGLAGVLAASALVPAAAEAQRWRDGDRGWHDGRHRGWDRRDDRRWDRDRRWRDERRHWRGGDRRYGWNGGYGRGRTVCRWQDGYYGPVKRCFRVRG